MKLHLKKKKAKKVKEPKEKVTEQYVVEGNRAFGEVLLEISSLYWKAKENFKGGTFSKAAKAVRECETLINNSKEAMKLKGVGKATSVIIDELKEKGHCERLETLRSGGF